MKGISGMDSKQKIIYIDTCVYGVEKLPLIEDYLQRYGDRIGFEVLPMFDLPAFEPQLVSCLDVLKRCPISFHGPVFCVEHSAPRGSAEYEETMWHIRKTAEYAKILRSTHLTMHLNNCVVEESRKQAMLKNALENYRELEDIFGAFGCRIAVENTGTKLQKNMLLDQQEFTELCAGRNFDVLVDVGHAAANGWDIPLLIRDLKDRICAYHLHNNDGIHDQHRRLHDGVLDFSALMETIRRETPDAQLIIEYVRPEQEGDGLRQDIEELLGTGC